MVTTTELKQEANSLRKEKRYEEALPIYRELWTDTGDLYDGTGLLQCLRKLGLFSEAIPLADDLIARQPELRWCHIEIAWTYIKGIIKKNGDNEEPLAKILDIAEKVMDLGVGDIAEKVVVRRVLKLASASGRWKTVNEWAIKIDPNALSTQPMIVDASGRIGWSEQATWYNYRIKGLIIEGNPNEIEEAIKLADIALSKFPRQRKYFQRHKASAKHSLGDLDEAERLYRDLCKEDRPEWWLIHGYARVVRDQNRKEDALKLMCQAAMTCQALKSMVSLLEDIGVLCLELEKYEIARAHFLLCRHIRNEENWSISEKLSDNIANTNQVVEADSEPWSREQVLRLCRSYWDQMLGAEKDLKKIHSINRKIRTGLTGSMIIRPNDKVFCFIAVEGEQPVYCPMSELPAGIVDGDEIAFDARPSYDKKKGQESWKACNVRYLEKSQPETDI